MKKYTKLFVLLTIVLSFCSGCVNANGDIQNAEYQNVYLCHLFKMDKFVLLKTTIDFSKEASEKDHILTFSHNSQIVLQNYLSKDNSNELALGTYLLDSYVYKYTIFGRYKTSTYFNSKKVISFLNDNYDYFYVYCENNDNNDSSLTSRLKRYQIFPFKNNQLQLNNTYNFQLENSLFPLNHEDIHENWDYEKDKGRYFKDLFWDGMNESELIDSFNDLKNNPPIYNDTRWHKMLPF